MRAIIFGNSGAGKSTLARSMSSQFALAHFDLDTVAWANTNPPQRRLIEESFTDIDGFINANENWVIEGCYSDLLEPLISLATHVYFLDLPIEACVDNARSRPWEPHKYASKEAQDANLNMLIDWIRAYETRSDSFSREAHTALFNQTTCSKERITANT